MSIRSSSVGRSDPILLAAIAQRDLRDRQVSHAVGTVHSHRSRSEDLHRQRRELLQQALRARNQAGGLFGLADGLARIGELVGVATTAATAAATGGTAPLAAAAGQTALAVAHDDLVSWTGQATGPELELVVDLGLTGARSLGAAQPSVGLGVQVVETGTRVAAYEAEHRAERYAGRAAEVADRLEHIQEEVEEQFVQAREALSGWNRFVSTAQTARMQRFDPWGP